MLKMIDRSYIPDTLAISFGKLIPRINSISSHKKLYVINKEFFIYLK